VGFDVGADAYNRFIGRYSELLAVKFVALAGVVKGQRALDVGCGAGALTRVLVERLGADAVSAVDPSDSLIDSTRSRFPAVDIRHASAEQLPFRDGTFDVVLAQLVVHFMKDPLLGLREMARVTRRGGLVGACVWDHAGGAGPLAEFWRAVRELDPHADDESGRAGVREGHLAELFAAAGIQQIESTVLTVRVGFANFDEWWEPFTLGVGPAGDYVAALDATHREELRASCAELFARAAPFDIAASAWAAIGRA